MAGRAPRTAPAIMAAAKSAMTSSAGPWRSQPLRCVSWSGTFVVVPTLISMTVAKVARSRQITPAAAAARRAKRSAFALGSDGREGAIPLL